MNTCGAGGQGKLDVKITSPSRRPIPCKLESATANELHTVKYIPPEEGPYRVDVSYDGNPVPGSPFTVEGVMPPDPSKVSHSPLTPPPNHSHLTPPPNHTSQTLDSTPKSQPLDSAPK